MDPQVLPIRSPPVFLCWNSFLSIYLNVVIAMLASDEIGLNC